MEPEVRRPPARFHEIDLLRFVAALSVVLYHYTFRNYAAGHYSPIPPSPLSAATKYGFLGVQLFFIISGYVMLLSAQGKTVRQFFVSRAARLYPAFWVACTLTFLTKLLWGTGGADAHMAPELAAVPWWQYAFNLTMLPEFFGVPALDGVYWSLTVEITFYFLVSLLLGYRLLHRLDWCLAGWLLYAALPGRFRLASPFATLLLPAYAPYFAAGMLFFLLQQPGGRRWHRLALLLLAYVLAVRSALDYSVFLTRYLHGDYSRPLVVGLVTGCFLVFGLLTLRLVSLRPRPWLRVAGALTYPLYLLHNDIASVAFHRLYGPVSGGWLLATALALMLGAAYLVHVLAERPLSQWLRQKLPGWLRYFDA